MRQDPPYDTLALTYGFSSQRTAQHWFDLILDFIYDNSYVLQRSRNLGNLGNMTELLEECHAATMSNSRFATAFLPVMNRYYQQQRLIDPNFVYPKLVGFCWDSRCVLCPHSSSFDHQRRMFSSKVKDNAIIKLACAGLDGVQRFIYM